MAEDAVWTKDEVVTEATRLRDLFRKMFTDRGSFNAVSYLYASRHPETGVHAALDAGRRRRDDRMTMPGKNR